MEGNFCQPNSWQKVHFIDFTLFGLFHGYPYLQEFAHIIKLLTWKCFRFLYTFVKNDHTVKSLTSLFHLKIEVLLWGKYLRTEINNYAFCLKKGGSFNWLNNTQVVAVTIYASLNQQEMYINWYILDQVVAVTFHNIEWENVRMKTTS